MLAMTLNAPGQPLALTELPLPEPGAFELLP